MCVDRAVTAPRRSVERLAVSLSRTPVAKLPRKRRKRQDDRLRRKLPVDHRKRKRLWEDSASALAIRRAYAGQCCSERDRCLDFVCETLTQPRRAFLVVLGLRSELNLRLRMKPNRLHRSERRTRAKTSSAGSNLTAPLSTSEWRFISSAFHAASTSGSSSPSSEASSSCARRARSSGANSLARCDNSATGSVMADLPECRQAYCAAVLLTANERTVFIRRRNEADRRHERNMAADQPRLTEAPLGGGRAAVTTMGSVRVRSGWAADRRAAGGGGGVAGAAGRPWRRRSADAQRLPPPSTGRREGRGHESDRRSP